VDGESAHYSIHNQTTPKGAKPLGAVGIGAFTKGVRGEKTLWLGEIAKYNEGLEKSRRL